MENQENQGFIDRVAYGPTIETKNADGSVTRSVALKIVNNTKELIGKTIQRTFHVAKAVELEGIEKSVGTDDDNTLWAYASVEVEDSARDIVRIAGIETDTYHRPPRTHLKILAQHTASSPTTGEAFIIGRVEEFKRTKTVIGDKIIPALAFKMSWAKDGQGNLTALAKSYKDLVDGGYLDSFSVGMLVHDYEELDTGGIDYTKTLLYEISCVSIPANGFANVMGKKSLPEESIQTLEAQVKSLLDLVTKQADFLAKLGVDLESTCKAAQLVEGLVTSHTEAIKKLDALDDRLDSIEAGIVVKSASPNSHQTDDRKSDTANEKLAEISKTLRNFAGR